MAERMKGKVVLVTGAGSSGPGWGNGKAAAVLYAREGAKVFAVDYRLEAAEETAKLITDEGGICVAHQADVSSSADVQGMAEKCQEVFGRIDVLHNNVGIVETGGPVEASEESWNRVVAVNQTSVFLTCKHVIPQMLKQKSGSIVNIGSIAGIRWIGFPYLAYSATKAALLAMTSNMAVQYAADGIRVNCVLPGLMNTPLIREPLVKNYGGDIDSMISQRDQSVPMGRMGDGWDTAYAALFLASDEARYISGTHLVVDGALTARSA
ncbi:SDR family NAD(P)-dependent oxidoreductase [Parapusillimonas granuli]|uniref:SDR family oxidoreductase n=1 Tax=Parapusillimonas granuli TaxID=380911 RepID=A0A853G347_9BURK|nr:SDR family oxidoreductase [Parapusillimonas granuli]MBB5214666.1 NAD(P)-dependent dehydrogenase (short-subunit alcohol dehydrogenase family) [Parapusillimonas granuli]MEB2398086.1 SDR family NAD(P)-dependent oxidoreductase [Alcaligenaceae bacterium]NYT48926.1 SDR family oxidoreductase [Parapusillimonas granuli]